MPKIDFVKMHGLGNDFVLVDNKAIPAEVSYTDLAKKMCDRHFGIGADGLVIINPLDVTSDTDIAWRIFNSDGTEPEMCGNAIRCFAKYVYDQGMVDKKQFTIWTLAGTIVPTIEDNGLVTVDMGSPVLASAKIPVKSEKNQVVAQPIEVLDKTFEMTCVSMGNPHCVIFSDEEIDLPVYGAALEVHDVFPQKTNVEFVKVLAKDHLKVDVWERGCGITLACGTGACACLRAGLLNNLCASRATVSLPGGDLVISYDETTDKLYMTGPATYVFSGTFAL